MKNNLLEMKNKSDNMPKHIYLMSNEDWYQKFKYGYTTDLNSRLCCSHEQHSSLTNFEYIFEVRIIPGKYLLTRYKEYDKIFSNLLRKDNYQELLNQKYNFNPTLRFPLLETIKKNLVNKNGGKEFIYQDGKEALLEFIRSPEGFQKLGIKMVKEFSPEKIMDINLTRKREYDKHNSYTSESDSEPDEPVIPSHKKPSTDYLWSPRHYQTEIIDKSIQELKDNHKIYIELATGGGKSYIVFNILKYFRPEVIVIFSPRKKINEQNMDERYLSLLEDEYTVFNMSSSISPDRFFSKLGKKIIICCSQSSKRLHEYILKYRSNFRNVMVWYDEAHWGFEEWKSVNKKKLYEKDNKGKYIEFKKFWLENTTIISKRVFVSASPNKQIVKNNLNIFGTLFKHKKVRDLIIEKWLCDIQTNIFEFEVDKDKANIVLSILESFKNTEKNWGFSFHNNQKNAFNLFYEHYILYQEGKTKIKPFLLISDKYETITDKKVEEDLELVEIREKTKSLRLDYDYRDEKIYELPENRLSMAYVVKKFSMGYDFEGIDYIIFTDRKTSYKDIIQSIGRGLRSDKKHKSEDGNLLNDTKKLHIDLPIYFEGEETEDDYEYKQIVDTLAFLTHDIEMNWSDLLKKVKKKKIVKKKNKFKGMRYEGSERVRQKILKILDRIKAIKSYPKFIEIMQDYNIYGSVEYHRFITDNISLGLPKNPALKYKEQQFCWYKVLSEEEKKKYYDSQDCIQRITEIRDELEEEGNEYFDEEDDFDEKLEFLHQKDNRIPNRNLWEFYGIEQKKFVVF